MRRVLGAEKRTLDGFSVREANLPLISRNAISLQRREGNDAVPSLLLIHFKSSFEAPIELLKNKVQSKC